MNSDKAESPDIELYKTYLEMTDRFSARRIQIPITYFTILSGLMIAMSFIIKEKDCIENLFKINSLLVAFSFMGMLLCLFWWQSIRAYRDLGKIKYDVIRDMEKNITEASFQPYTKEIEIDGQPHNNQSATKKIATDKQPHNKKPQISPLEKLTRFESALPIILVIPFLFIPIYLICEFLIS